MVHNNLYERIFQAGQFSSGETERLRKIVADHPYFSLAHFFLLKAADESHADYSALAARTALHFQNPFLLQYQLNRKTLPAAASNPPEAPENIPAPAETMPVETPVTPVESTVSPGEELISRMAEELSRKEVPVKAQDELLFEPLYTTDYFASQGIKLSEEVQSADKLGKQLRSFTEWLKTMKKKQAQSAAEETTVPLDPAVEHMAEKSNTEADVLTETMAEVLLEQGKYRRARDIYEKLLLQNPAKSAYFAAKIDSLKDK